MRCTSFSRRLPLRLSVLAGLLVLAGCNAWQNRAEFAAPQSRWNASQPSPVAADAPPPPIRAQYCYRTLAEVDCYTEARPDRIAGYTGVYPDPDSLATAAPYTAPPRQPLFPSYEVQPLVPSNDAK